MMYDQFVNDLNNLDEILSLTKDKALEYLIHLNQAAVSITPAGKLPSEGLPLDGSGSLETLKEFYRQHHDKIVAASGPRYWGYVIGGTTPAAISGDWLTSVFDQSSNGTSPGGDISALIEHQTIGWLRDLFGLPAIFKGGFVTGATMANFTGLAVARQWAGHKNNNDIAREGIKTEMRILSATPHSSAVKSLAMLGLGSNQLITVRTMDGNREAIDILDLEQKLIENADFPIILISSAGTVNTVDFDDMQAIASLQKKYDFFWHVDAAFGAFAACSETTSDLIAGWQFADSIAVDCHKWLNVPYDSAIYLINERHLSLQLQTFQNSNAPYLGDPLAHFNYLNAGPENSRRLRALPAWFSLNAYGKNGYRWIVENSVRLAKTFGANLEKRTDFVLAAPVRLNVVCFTTKNQESAETVLHTVYDRLNVFGKVFLTITNYKGIPCLRAAFVNWRTTDEDVWTAIAELVLVSK